MENKNTHIMKTSTKIIIATFFIILAGAFAFMNNNHILPQVSPVIQSICFLLSLAMSTLTILSITPKEPESKYRHSFNSPNWGYSYQDIEVQADRWEEERMILKELKE